MKNKKGQASLEYMVMLAISLMIFAVVIGFSMNMVSNVKSQLGVDTAYKAVEEIKEASDFIYVHGHPSRTEIEVYIPPNIEAVSIPATNNSIIARISVGESYTDIYGVTKGRVYGDLSAVTREGYYVFRVESTSDEAINITLV